MAWGWLSYKGPGNLAWIFVHARSENEWFERYDLSFCLVPWPSDWDTTGGEVTDLFKGRGWEIQASTVALGAGVHDLDGDRAIGTLHSSGLSTVLVLTHLWLVEGSYHVRIAVGASTASKAHSIVGTIAWKWARSAFDGCSHGAWQHGGKQNKNVASNLHYIVWFGLISKKRLVEWERENVQRFNERSEWWCVWFESISLGSYIDFYQEVSTRERTHKKRVFWRRRSGGTRLEELYSSVTLNYFFKFYCLCVGLEFNNIASSAFLVFITKVNKPAFFII